MDKEVLNKEIADRVKLDKKIEEKEEQSKKNLAQLLAQKDQFNK
jgi:hypothetical protein